MASPSAMFRPELLTKTVDDYWLRQCYNMGMNDPMIRSCLALLEKCMRFKEMRFVGIRKSGALDRALHDVFDEFCPHVMHAIFMWGFVPILMLPRKWNASWDPEFVENVKAGMLEMSVPLIPAFGTYKIEIVVDPVSMQPHFNCYSIIHTDLSNFPKLYVVEGGSLSPPPRFDTGELRSVLHAMRGSFNALIQREAFATAAEFTRSGPPVALQQSDKVEGITNKITLREYGGSELERNANKVVYAARAADAEALRNEQRRVHDEMRGMAASRSAYFTDPLNIQSKPMELSHPLITQTIQIPDGLEISTTQPTLPEAPADLEERHQRHFLTMCDSFQIPVSLFAYARKDGIVREISDSDQAMLSGTMRRIGEEMTRVMMQMLHLMGLTDQVKSVEFTPVTYVNVEMLKELFLAGAIEPEEFDRIVETSSGLKIKTREPLELTAKLEKEKANLVASKSTAKVAEITAAAAARETSSSSSSNKRAKNS